MQANATWIRGTGCRSGRCQSRLQHGQCVALGESDDRAYDQQRGRFHFVATGGFGQIGQFAEPHLLLRAGGAVNEGGRRGGGQAGGLQLAHDFIQAADAHVNHQRLPRLRQCGPVQMHAVVFQMSGGEDAALGVVAVRRTPIYLSLYTFIPNESIA